MASFPLRPHVRRARWALGLLLATLAVPLPARAQPVQGDVRSVGFQAAVPSRFIVRNGQWFPILVELTAQGSQPYDVELRSEQADLDGDQVDFIEPHVAVTPDVGIKRVWCYAATLGNRSGPQAEIDVIGDDGALITSLPLPAFESIGNDTQLILDISDKRVTGLGRLDSGAVAYSGPNWGLREFYRAICVATLPARDLPDRWYGLEAADVIVWDEPDPEALPSNQQLPALIEWVRHGGQLVLGIGPAWSKVQKSALGGILPLIGDQPTVEVRALPTFAGRYRRSVADGFEAPIPVARGEPAPDALVTFRDQLPNHDPINLIAMRAVGSGRVIATAARLHDLIGPGLSDTFYDELIDLNRNDKKFQENEAQVGILGHNVQWLHQPLIAQIEFRRLASARVLAAFAFVGLYILIATYGTWAWLKRRSLTHVSWTAFAAFAVVASVLSLGAVGLSRGVAGAVHSFSFVDLEAGSTHARATTYFGYKSSRRQLIDISLPGADNYLRPLATPDLDQVAYATPQRYADLTAAATLAGTPMRATLKEFEGAWEGDVSGSIRGSLTADRASGQITPQSWLQNDLDVPITGGYLLYIDPRLRAYDGGVPFRVAGLDTCNYRPADKPYYGSAKVPPAVNVLALRIPPLPPGEKQDRFGLRPEAPFGEYAVYEQRYAAWSAKLNPNSRDEPMLPTLRHRQLDEWIASFGMLRGFVAPVQPVEAAALLASTRDLYLHNDSVTDFEKVGQPISTAGLVDRDITHWLTRGQAVLLLLCAQPGPATLHLDGQPKPASAGQALYRVRIPLTYTRGSRGSAP